MGPRIMFHFALFLTSPIFLISFLGECDLHASSFMLDEEAVFCVYHKMNANEMEDQDIEDFCYYRGRPTFTAYKPSEMFTKNSLREFRSEMEKKIKDISNDSLFTWRVTGEVSYRHDGKGVTVKCNFQDMPQATYYINSGISKAGIRSIKRKLSSLVKRRAGSITDRKLDITISMRPQKIVHRFQKRNIALEEVLLPIRYVIFHPIKLEALDETMTF